ncbi:hypothetical protein GTY62_30215 [Streptomyces sp. SID724]|uniref:hypothetical protein n=1 Tax=Streptomyces sp. SID724 TaxID=2690324 RepID=UPI001361DD42|nr:hypothetical protein [Streptomyces sp. SID724]
MQPDDKPINGQQHNPNCLDLLKQTPSPPGTDKEPGATRFARLRVGWNASWEQGGFLHGRWEDLRQAPNAGWHGMANWIKALLIIIGLCALLVLLDTAADISNAPATPAGTDASSAFWGVVDNPVRTYIAEHTTGLPVSSTAVYTFWQLTGAVGLICGFLGATGARLTWTAWGAATTWAVWATTPADGRTIATAITLLAWTIASTLALRGLSLRLVVNNFIPPAPAFQPQIEIRPEIRLPAPSPEPDDNVHPLR